MRKAFVNDGTGAAFDIFDRIYQKYDFFASSGCHRHAHRVGDLSYYFDYLTHKDLSQTEFPENANACGYGFYHGFFEHLIQDNPDPAFVTETCEYLSERLAETAPAMRQTCYHGSGHGFVLAQADKFVDESTWSTAAFIDKPLAACESLPKATEWEVAECRQGVYNVLADWMADREYNLAFDYEHPFQFCDREPYERQHDCYYEMAQKVGPLVRNNSTWVIDLVEQTPRADLQDVVLGVVIAGLVSEDPKGPQDDLLATCRLIEDSTLAALCMKSIIGGLIEHATTAGDYQTAFAFCARSDLSGEERATCHTAVATRIRRYQTEEELQASCDTSALPQDFCTSLQAS